MLEDFFSSLNSYDVLNSEFVEINREGKVAPDQERALRSRVPGYGEFLRGGMAWERMKILVWLVLFLTVGLWSLNVHPFYVGSFFVLGLVGLVGLSLWFWKRTVRQMEILNRELSESAVRSGIGEVVFQGQGYQARVEGRTLTLEKSIQGKLSPGVRYRIYYLPESGTVLSVESLSPVPEREAVRGLTEVLAEVNHFSLSALADNRRGVLASDQSGALTGPLLLGVFLFALPLIVIGIGFYHETGFLRPLREGISLGEVAADLPTAAVIIIPLLVGLGFYGLYLAFTAVMDLSAREVVSREGVGFRELKDDTDADGDTRTNYYYVIGGQRFQVSEEAYQAFKDGKNYRAFFTPRRKRLVNLEVLD